MLKFQEDVVNISETPGTRGSADPGRPRAARQRPARRLGAAGRAGRCRAGLRGAARRRVRPGPLFFPFSAPLFCRSRMRRDEENMSGTCMKEVVFAAPLRPPSTFHPSAFRVRAEEEEESEFFGFRVRSLAVGRPERGALSWLAPPLPAPSAFLWLFVRPGFLKACYRLLIGFVCQDFVRLCKAL